MHLCFCLLVVFFLFKRACVHACVRASECVGLYKLSIKRSLPPADVPGAAAEAAEPPAAPGLPAEAGDVAF